MTIIAAREYRAGEPVTEGAAAVLDAGAQYTAIAGIYGMNFDNMPELRMVDTYFAVPGIIAVICMLLYLRFKRVGWL